MRVLRVVGIACVVSFSVSDSAFATSVAQTLPRSEIVKGFLHEPGFFLGSFDLDPSLAETTAQLDGVRAVEPNDPLSLTAFRGLSGSRVAFSRFGLPIFDLDLPGIDGTPVDPRLARVIVADFGFGLLARHPGTGGAIELPLDGIDGLSRELSVHGATADRAAGLFARVQSPFSSSWEVHGYARRSDDVATPEGDVAPRRIALGNGGFTARHRISDIALELGYERFGGRVDRPLSFRSLDATDVAATRLERDLDDNTVRLIAATEFDRFGLQLRNQWQRHALDALVLDGSREPLAMVLESYLSEFEVTPHLGEWRTSVGVTGRAQRTRTTSPSRLVPDTRTVGGTAFANIGRTWPALQADAYVEVGARHLEAHDDPSLALPTQSRAFDDVSFGARLRRPVIGRGGSIEASFGRAYRPPTSLELYAHGPSYVHDRFELGDRHLPNERSTGVDLTGAFHGAPWTAHVTGFARRLTDFVELEPTDEVIDGWAAYQYSPRTARLVGAEGEVRFEMVEGLSFGARADYVNGQDGTHDRPLSSMPPARTRLESAWTRSSLFGMARFSLAAAVEGHGRATRLGPLDAATAPYALLHVGVDALWRFTSQAFRMQVAITNLTNAKARSFTSRDPALAPIEGRSVQVRIAWAS